MYKNKEDLLDLPLSVESIDEWIQEKSKSINTLSDVYFKLPALQIELYRDVLKCISLGASHGQSLSVAALKLEEIFDKFRKDFSKE